MGLYAAEKARAQILLKQYVLERVFKSYRIASKKPYLIFCSTLISCYSESKWLYLMSEWFVLGWQEKSLILFIHFAHAEAT